MTSVLSTLLHHKSGVKNGFYMAKYILNLNYSQSLYTIQRPFSTGNVSRHAKRDNELVKYEKQLPTLIYIQNPITWMINKIDFKMLKSAWDPEFDESEFRRGSIQAVSVICTLISRNMWESLRGLISRQALVRLQRDVEVNWSDEQRQNIFIESSDVRLALPRKVHFLRIAEKKFVDVDMMFVAMRFKDVPSTVKNDLVLIELVARFHRNYTTGEIPNWTVTLFKVTRFNNSVPSK
ncbi:hypothetical protein RUM43_003677 [Polyplax serrata]|uniref:Tim44-like domain-containing protein n=1 Tax=Polyplax serrata TaxID=468196 RepID=A0AAN8S9F7_POLSC